MDLHGFVSTLVSGGEPPPPETFTAFLASIQSGERHPVEVAAVLAALSARPADVRLIVPFVRFLEESMPPKTLPGAEAAVSLVGTGGGVPTFNISTTAAFAAAAAGAVVLKTGSAAYSSRSGSQDVLARLGLGVPMDDTALATMIAEVGIGFVHPARHAPFLRRLALAVQPLELRRIGHFINRIGPFLRPFTLKGQLTGVGRRQDLEVLTAAMAELGRTNVMLVHAELGLDELTSLGLNHCHLIGPDGGLHSWTQLGGHLAWRSVDFGWLAGGGPDENAMKLIAVLRNDAPPEAIETVALNAAAALQLAGVAGSLGEGVELARRAIRDRRAFARFEAATAFCAHRRAVAA